MFFSFFSFPPWVELQNGKMVSFEKAPGMELTRISLNTPCFYVCIFLPWSSAATWIYLCDKARQGGITSLVSQHNTVWHNKQHNTVSHCVTQHCVPTRDNFSGVATTKTPQNSCSSCWPAIFYFWHNFFTIMTKHNRNNTQSLCLCHKHHNETKWYWPVLTMWSHWGSEATSTEYWTIYRIIY